MGTGYEVKIRQDGTGSWCSCWDHERRRMQCKHILAATADMVDSQALEVLGEDAWTGESECFVPELPAPVTEQKQQQKTAPELPGPAAVPALPEPTAEQSHQQAGDDDDDDSIHLYPKETTGEKEVLEAKVCERCGSSTLIGWGK